MKRIYVFIFLFCIPILIFASKTIIRDGIKYTIHNDNTLSCSAANKKELVDVIIPSSIDIDGFQYYVTSVDKNGFYGCKNLRSIEFSNDVVNFEPQAFWNCTNLESVIMPDEAVAKVFDGNYGYGGGGIFKGCKNLSRVRGNTILYPRYVLYDAFRQCEDTPFYKTIQELGAANMTNMKMANSFSDFTLNRSKEKIENWQRRKDYETLAQWEARVTDSNRLKMIEEAFAESKIEYIKMLAPGNLKGRLEDYNYEYGFFPVSTHEFGLLYVSVPTSEKENFFNNWAMVDIIPEYGIMDDSLGILSCSFKLNDKVYNSAVSYDEDDVSMIAAGLTPLASLREYEQMIASGDNTKQNKTQKYAPDEIDIIIPDNSQTNENTFAVIIGNENYQRVSPVDYAMNDARIFEKYCNLTLGIPEKNIRTYYDATYGDIIAAMEDITKISEAFNGDINVIFYYAGHGMPDEGNRNAYILPVDASSMQTEACYPLNKLYSQLSDLNAKSVLAFIDACFSGSLRGEGMLASVRGIKLKPREIPVSGNLVVLTAASADQSALPYPEKNHGLFSFYLLKKLNETKGEVTIGELSDFVIDEVSKQSIVEAKKSQIPSLKVSDNLSKNWRDLKLKN